MIPEGGQLPSNMRVGFFHGDDEISATSLQPRGIKDHVYTLAAKSRAPKKVGRYQLMVVAEYTVAQPPPTDWTSIQKVVYRETGPCVEVK